MPRAERITHGVCDSYCDGCAYYCGNSFSFKVCEYMLATGRRRPCPAGSGCTVKAKRKGRSLRKVIDDQVTAYTARAAAQEQKKAMDKLSRDLNESERSGFGVRYGAWKATQPVQETVKPEEEGLKECPFCGEKFKPKSKNAKYCCPDHQIAAYAQNEKYRARQRVYQRQARERQKAIDPDPRLMIESAIPGDTQKKGISMVGFDICDGNPGALRFLMDAYQVDMFKAEAAFQRMQDNHITGTKLYVLWNDCCGRDTKQALQIAHTAPVDKIVEHINYEGGRGFPFNEEELAAIC